MRDYNRIADRVFQRRDEYLAEKKRKRAIYIKRASLALSCCVMLLVGFGIWKMDLLKKITPGDDDFIETTTAAITTTITATTSEPAAGTTVRTTTSADTTETSAVTSADDISTTRPSASGTTAASTGGSRQTTRSHGPTVTTLRTTASGTEVTAPSRTTSHKPRTTTTTKNEGSNSPRTTTSARATTTRTTTRPHIITSILTTTTRIYTTVTRPITTTKHVGPETTSPPVTSTGSPIVTTASNTYLPVVTTWHTSTSASHTWYTTITATMTSVVYTSSTYQGSDFKTFYYNDTLYTLASVKYTATGYTGSELARGVTKGLNESGTVAYTVYRYKDYDPRFLCAAKADLADEAYVAINRDFVPNDLADLVTVMKLGSRTEITYAKDLSTDEMLDDVSPSLLADALMSQGSAKPEETAKGDTQLMTFMLKLDDIPKINFERADGYVDIYKNGLIHFYIDGEHIYFDVSPDGAKSIYNRLKK